MIKSRKIISSLGLILTVIGLSGLILFAYYWHRNSLITAEAKAQDGPIVMQPTVVSSPESLTGKPVSLSIESLNLELNVKDGIYNPRTAEWTLSNDSVHYALITAQPNNQSGNTLIYGHYRPGVFSTLKTIKPGSEVIVNTDNNLEFRYRFVGSKTVNPSDGAIFEYNGKPMLTLQTCTGAFMQNRQLFSFEFVEVNKK